MLEKGNGHPTHMEVAIGFPLVAVAIDKNKGSQSALQWAVDNLVLKGQVLTLIHVKVESHSLVGHKDSKSHKVKDIFLPFRCFCLRKDIYCKDVLLGGHDVAKAIAEFVSHAAIEKLVVGASSKSAFLRRFGAGQDIAGNITKKAPNFCSIYAISKGKLSSTRAALLPAPTNSPFRDQIRSDASFKPDTFGCNFSRVWSDVLRGMPWDDRSLRHDDQSVRSRPSNVKSSKTDDRRSMTDGVAYFAWSDADRPSSASSAATRPSGACALPSRESSASEFGFEHDFDRIATPRRELSSCLAGPAFGWIEHESDDGITALSPTAMEGMEEEVKRLKQQLDQTMDMYNRACKEAVAAKQKAAELQSWRSEEAKRLEAQTIEEAAIELEAQRRSLLERKLKREVEEQMRELYSLSQIDDVRYRRFSMEEIEIATESFAESLKIGEGGYGSVYKCYLDHTKVAVKVLRSNATQDQLAEFQREIELVSCIRHPNIVLLLGACPEHRCLVYEYMANGSLEDRLFRRGNTPAIPWQFRFIIAAEIATGLLFLHHMKPEPIVYRVLKPGSILLDKHYVSKISDVGLAPLVPTSSVSGDITAVPSFCCYVDPEYLQTGLPAVESDIYSLGVVLMQILTAKPPEELTELVRLSIEEDKFAGVLDPAVADWPVDEAQSLAELALKCTETQRIHRADLATTVMSELKRLRDLAEDSMLCQDNFSDSVWTPSGSESSRTNSSGSWATC